MTDATPALLRDDARRPDTTGDVAATVVGVVDSGTWRIPALAGTRVMPVRSAGVAITGLALIAIVGHAAPWPRLVQPVGAFAPVTPFGAVVPLVIGAALLDPALRGRRVGRPLAVVVILLALLGIATVLAGEPSSTAFRTADPEPLAWLVIGIGLLALRERRRWLEARALAGACGLAVFVLGGVLLAVNARMLVGAGTSAVPLALRLSPHAILVLLLAGGALLAGVVAMPARTGATLPRWAPWLVGAATVACTVAVWRVVARAQDGQLRELVAGRAALVRTGIEDALAGRPLAPDSALRRVVAAALPGGGEGYGGAVTRADYAVDTIGRPLPAAGTPSAPHVVDTRFRAGGHALVLHLWPTPRLVAATRTNLPELVLVLGTVLAGLLVATLRLVGALAGIARREERAELLLALASVDRAVDYEWELGSDHMMRPPEIARGLGLAPERLALAASDWRRRIHPDDRPAFDAGVREHRAGRTPEYVMRYRVQAADGSWHTFIDRGRVVERDRDGRASRIVGLAVDLDAQVPAAPSPFGLGTLAQVMLAPNGHVITHTRAAERYLVPHPVTRGRRLATADEVDETALAHLLHLAAVDTTARGELHLRDPEGVVHTMELAVTPLREAGGRRGDELLVELWDVTGRRAAEAARAETERLMTLGRLSARVAHEINNPLAGIRTAFQLVKRGLPPDDAAWPFAEAIEREIQRIAAVTRQLYETYRPDRSPPTAAVATVVHDCVALLGVTARGRGITVIADLADAPACAQVPEAALRQAVYNLVQNAIEASPPEGTVTVVVAGDDAALHLVVRDEGPGIPVEQRGRVFEEGFSTKAGSPATSGLGIGLALVRHSVTALGGTIAVHDAAGGRGAEFRVALPLAPTPVRSGAAAA
jgi:signal transduction histidine kinase